MERRGTHDERELEHFALGFLLVWMLVDARPRDVSAEVAARTPDDLASPATPDLSRMSARELRRLSGLGRARAESVARARFERDLGGDPRAYDVVHGVGPATIDGMRRDLGSLARRVPGGEGAAYTPPPSPP